VAVALTTEVVEAGFATSEQAEDRMVKGNCVWSEAKGPARATSCASLALRVIAEGAGVKLVDVVVTVAVLVTSVLEVSMTVVVVLTVVVGVVVVTTVVCKMTEVE
jgi:hypothetical protein